MNRIHAICQHPLWKAAQARLEELEQDRVFCGHSLNHLLDVARLAYIESLEQGLQIPRDLIYGAALLHDLGRVRQYEQGEPHDQAGARLAAPILADCGFTREEQDAIIGAILAHRRPETRTDPGLAGLLYRADKASRLCLFCPVRAACNWPEDQMNLTLNR